MGARKYRGLLALRFLPSISDIIPVKSIAMEAVWVPPISVEGTFWTLLEGLTDVEALSTIKREEEYRRNFAFTRRQFDFFDFSFQSSDSSFRCLR